jgi:hypothetical protein
MKKSALPKPNVTYVPLNSDVRDEKSVKGMICNPIYTGVPPFRRIVSDEAWIQAAMQLIAEEGPEQFLVNMLYMLRQSMREHQADQATAITPDTEDISFEFATPALPLYCYHDDFPMVEIQGAYVCVAEYIFEHLDNVPVTDLITRPTLTLIFQNGHTLPLIQPEYDQSIPPNDEDQLLNILNGLSIIDVEWDDENQAITLDFGSPIINDEEEEITPAVFITVHLDSIRQMTCPYQSGADPTVYSTW